MIYDELPSSWRFVDDEKKLSKYSGEKCKDCKQENPVVLTHINTLPSFVFRTTGYFFTPVSFDLNNDTGSIDLSSEIPNMRLFTIGSYTYVAYNQTNFASTPLSTGTYEATISDGITTFYSEPITICDDISRCVRFEWHNTCDLSGIPYSYLQSAFAAPFTNSFSADLELVNAEYETEKEKLENMLRQTDVFYNSQTRTFSLKNPVIPDWFARCVQVMQMHSSITVIYDIDTNHNGVYRTELEECTVITSPNEDCNSKMEIRFRQDDAIVTTSCCVNSEPEPCLEACYTVNGFAQSGFPAEGEYQIMDFDSNIIKKYIGGGEYGPPIDDCNYVLNSADGTHLFYNGDSWFATPDITSAEVQSVSMGVATLLVIGYTMPNTWVYIGVNNGDGCIYGTTAYLPEQLAEGVLIEVPDLTAVDLCIKSQNHTCTYDERELHFEL